MAAFPQEAAFEDSEPPAVEAIDAMAFLLGEGGGLGEVADIEVADIAAEHIVDEGGEAAIIQLRLDCLKVWLVTTAMV